ncbi:MAG: hypothetical protein ACKOPK_11175 [Dolichospermum sp.]
MYSFLAAIHDIGRRYQDAILAFDNKYPKTSSSYPLDFMNLDDNFLTLTIKKKLKISIKN